MLRYPSVGRCLDASLSRYLSGRQSDKADGDDEVDDKECLEEEGEGVEGEPGEQLVRLTSSGAHKQEQIGEEEKKQKDQL